MYEVLLVDSATNAPVTLDYGLTTERQSDASGIVTSVRIPFEAGKVTGALRAYLMVDTYPSAKANVTIP
ncbi:MAG: hypothetical protein U0165_13300 [Polyangiaceae bacterium]